MASTIRSPRQQLDTFRGLIAGRTLDRKSPTFGAALQWMKTYPGELSQEELLEFRQLVCSCWQIGQVDLDDALAQKNPDNFEPLRGYRYTPAELQRARDDEAELDSLVPASGFFRDYIRYTMESEAPMLYHFFTGVAGLAATINRRCGFDMGPTTKIYPPLGVMLLGPSGIKKTSSSDIMVNILTDMQVVPIYSEKVTPEALVDGMKKGQAVGLIYAPELSVFLGKQSYMEGIVPLLTRLMDSPDKWTTATISRGETTLTNIALTSLMCSTSDWFVSNTPADMFGGGFIARNLLIHQTISPRIIPIPRTRDEKLRQEIINKMLDMHVLMGEMAFTPSAMKYYEDFYYQNKLEKPEHEMLEAYHQRKGSHAIRLAMLLHISTHGTMEICLECFERSLAILKFTERFLPPLLKGMFRTEAGLETDKVLRVISGFNAPIPHSTLVRKLQYAMNAAQVKKVLAALKESGDVKENSSKFSHTYEIKEEGDE